MGSVFAAAPSRQNTMRRAKRALRPQPFGCGLRAVVLRIVSGQLRPGMAGEVGTETKGLKGRNGTEGAKAEGLLQLLMYRTFSQSESDLSSLPKASSALSFSPLVKL